ncbi:SURF1 family protein [Methylocystis sp. IM3]|jgi:surfeit locus 1 family protein|uniref:SURF1 family protein n=1 Tax=unclassified Methylocystis TaxID=2625913 RepID=UPI000FC2C7FF|nr:MAG: SURF1 family protein [Hyphomicrobiales bacterium]
MRSAARALVWPAAAAALVAALLVGLGVWQLRRLAEKEALIARVEARVHLAAKPVPPPSEWAALDPAEYEFSHVTARGRYLPGRDALVFMKPPEGFGLEPGYMVLTPFALAEGGVIFVERGFVPTSRAEDAAGRAPPSGETTLTGLMHGPQRRNAFTPADTPDRFIWFTRDAGPIAARLGLSDAAPFTLALEAPASAGPNGFPRPASTAPEFANNHLSYALTWFSLAVALVVMFALFARARLASGA